MYVVAVLFEIEEAHAGAFREAILENAATSLREEAGCRRFDVAFGEDGRRCFLYELYADRAAFDVHLESEHFRAFGEATAPMVRGKRVETYALAENPHADA